MMLGDQERIKRNLEIVKRGGLDNEMLYHEFLDSIHARQEDRERRHRTADMAIRKSLNLPLDDDGSTGIQITRDESKQGLGWKEILAAGGITAAGLLGWKFMERPPETTPVSPVVVQQPEHPQAPPVVIQPPPPVQGKQGDDTSSAYDLKWGN